MAERKHNADSMALRLIINTKKDIVTSALNGYSERQKLRKIVNTMNKVLNYEVDFNLFRYHSVESDGLKYIFKVKDRVDKSTVIADIYKTIGDVPHEYQFSDINYISLLQQYECLAKLEMLNNLEYINESYPGLVASAFNMAERGRYDKFIDLLSRMDFTPTFSQKIISGIKIHDDDDLFKEMIYEVSSLSLYNGLDLDADSLDMWMFNLSHDDVSQLFFPHSILSEHGNEEDIYDLVTYDTSTWLDLLGLGPIDDTIACVSGFGTPSQAMYVYDLDKLLKRN